MAAFDVRPLDTGTWAAFAAMLERHHGVFGGCWCTYFHTLSADKERTYEANRSLKQRLVGQDRAHAALVCDGDEAVAWCQFGSPAELPNIYHRKQYDLERDLEPDYRITCIFVDKRHRRSGLSAVALQGALDEDLADRDGYGAPGRHPLPSPAEVAHAFCGSRLGTSYDGTYGALSSPTSDLTTLMERATPEVP